MTKTDCARATSVALRRPARSGRATSVSIMLRHSARGFAKGFAFWSVGLRLRGGMRGRVAACALVRGGRRDRVAACAFAEVGAAVWRLEWRTGLWGRGAGEKAARDTVFGIEIASVLFPSFACDHADQ